MTTLSSIGFHSPACCIAGTLKNAWHITHKRIANEMNEEMIYEVNQNANRVI